MQKNELKLRHITPKIAERYLNDNKGNRSLRSGVVERYASDMKLGRWTDCPVPISFYDSGEIADGQHRLYAVIESGCTVPFFVLEGLPQAAGLNIDTGVGRSLVDNGRISGIDPNLSNTLVALAVFYSRGERVVSGLSNSARLEIVAKYRVPCEWAVHNGPTGRGFRNSVVLCAMARAYHHGESPERIQHFAKVLQSGFADGAQDSAAIAMRNYMIARQLRFGNSELRDLFLKMQNAIHHFVRRKALTFIKTVSEEWYPIVRQVKG